MPTTPIIESNNPTRRMFAYDEMVMASDGTRFYIKYLDGPGPKQAQTSQQQRQTQSGGTTVVARPSTANQQLMIRNQGSGVGAKTVQTTIPAQLAAQMGNEAKRQKTGASPFLPTQPQPGRQQLQCGICRQKFSNVASLNFHIDKAHKDTDGPIDCPCGKRFANKKYMKRHQKRRYETERIICGREKQAGGTATTGFQLNYKNL